MVKLNLGAGDEIIEDFLSVDIVASADIICDLNATWPWPDSSVDEVRAFHIFEHLPNRIHTMNELWRVLKPDAIATIEVPNAARGSGYFQDPTHCAPWCMNSWQYVQFDSPAWNRFHVSYGITAAFEIVLLTERCVMDVVEPVYLIDVVLKAIKKIPDELCLDDNSEEIVES